MEIFYSWADRHETRWVPRGRRDEYADVSFSRERPREAELSRFAFPRFPSVIQCSSQIADTGPIAAKVALYAGELSPGKELFRPGGPLPCVRRTRRSKCPSFNPVFAHNSVNRDRSAFKLAGRVESTEPQGVNSRFASSSFCLRGKMENSYSWADRHETRWVPRGRRDESIDVTFSRERPREAELSRFQDFPL